MCSKIVNQALFQMTLDYKSPASYVSVLLPKAEEANIIGPKLKRKTLGYILQEVSATLVKVETVYFSSFKLIVR